MKFKVDDVEAALAALKRAGVEPDGPQTQDDQAFHIRRLGVRG